MKTNTREKIEIMQAHLDGSVVEFLDVASGEYLPVPYRPKWNWGRIAYRIKTPTKEMTVKEIEEALGYTIKVVK